MSASFHRMTLVRPQDPRWAASRDALDLAGDILDEASEIKRAGGMLMAYPADVEERMKARNAARKVIAACDALEALS